MTLERVLADWRERANTLRMTNHGHDAALIEKVLDHLVSTLPEYLVWLSEGEAMMYEGRRTPDALRTRFIELEARGLAKWDGRRRLYRRIALRHQGNPEAAREAGRRAGKGRAA